jgi:hypothetical protein
MMRRLRWVRVTSGFLMVVGLACGAHIKEFFNKTLGS